MKVMIVGSGGREAALARSIAASPGLGELLVAPGNPGTAALARNLPLALGDIEGLLAAALAEKVDLVVVGPEEPLAAGLADALRAGGIACYGPGRSAARIESSKSFSKAFMLRHGIPTAEARVFSEAGAARGYIGGLDSLPVVKASGLAAGKGVVLPASLEEAFEAVDRLLALGGPDAEILVEERLEGEELSLMAFSDGRDWAPMPAARDHKRLLEGDRGPNTGGMGAFAPALPEAEAKRLADLVIAPAIAGLAAEGSPFVGTLFAGLILGPRGPRVLEYNCRFGDPETQAVLPLLEGDLLAVLEACAQGRLRTTRPRWKPGFAACVVVAAEGYPEAPVKGRPIRLPALPEEGGWFLHAGTAMEGGVLVSTGGRVIDAVAVAGRLDEALAASRGLAASVGLEGGRFRRDIGSGAAGTDPFASALARRAGSSAYASSGVDIDAGSRAVELMKDSVRSTYGPEVLAGIGSFGGLFDAAALGSTEGPVLVSSTDGVGTKAALGAALGRLAGLGEDIVNHSIDDILVQGARPLFFLDYIAADRIVPEKVAEIVSGMAGACRAAGCALIGGETAEMPGTYREGSIDIAGTIVGLVESRRILPRADIEAGDLLVGLASSGLHTNGYSLARRAFAGLDLLAVHPELGESPADALLRPHRSYLGALLPALSAPGSPVKALAHITGGGFIENIPRILPGGLHAVVETGSWPRPPVFGLIARLAGVEEGEMARVFNLGIGMVVVVAPGDLDRLRDLVPEALHSVGRIAAGPGGTVLA